jgi:ribose transport system ATP-binding protein
LAEPRLIVQGIHKHFGSTPALQGVDLAVRAGEVHALIGENGAGKSTLMKVLSGAEFPDKGTLVLDGVPYAPADPQAARRSGVAMVYQELNLAPDLSVEANVLLGVETSRLGVLAGRRNRQRVQEALAILGHPEIHPDRLVGQLSTGARQLVEIARGLVTEVRLLILDEPTSSLAQDDVQRLFDLVHRLRDRGVSILYISHFLEEVQAVADRFTVLRDGRDVGSGAVTDFTPQGIIELMVGRSLAEQFPRVPHTIGPPILDIEDLEGMISPAGARLVLRRGEILGLAGIVGAGRTEFLRVLFGLDPVKRGVVRIGTVSSPRATPRARIRQGVGFVSEDRKSEGLALERSIADNLTYSWLHPYAFLGWLRLRRRRQAVAGWLARLGVRHRDPEQPVGELSGGNQQKVALARLLHQEAEILLLDEPTRGVDVQSKAEIYRLIGELARQGKAILFVSSYLPELLGVCDTLTVMVRGQLSAVRPVEQWSPTEVLTHATGQGSNDPDSRMQP